MARRQYTIIVSWEGDTYPATERALYDEIRDKAHEIDNVVDHHIYSGVKPVLTVKEPGDHP